MNTAKIELHLHLDGSLELPWAYEKSIKEGVIPRETTFEEYYNMLYNTKYASREDGFRKFELTCAVMQTRENLIESIYNLIKQLNDEGLVYAEIRYASQQHTLKGLSQADTVDALCEGIRLAKKDFPDIEIGLLNCFMHKGPDANFNMKENMEALEASMKYLGKGLVGMDLAGYENNGDYSLYKPLFDKCKEYGMPLTAHAGEMGNGENVIKAINMGANRIGHGVHCVDNDEWLREVVKTQIPLEVCVSSNVKAERNYAAHPVRKLIEAGAKVTLKSDTMMFSRTCLKYEHYILNRIGVTEQQLWQTTLNALDAAFCSEETKAKIRAKLGV